MNYIRQNVNFVRQIGLKRAFWLLMREGDLRAGTLVGEDSLGNKYFEDNTRPLGRNRWVEYKSWNDYEASQITAEWHRWMHNISDFPPANDPRMNYRPKFLATYKPNLSGTKDEYVPYSTTPSKIQEWIPNKK
eukprot:Opistho-2@73384